MGTDLLGAGGVLAAFFAGGVALFAPCCIVFLAPSYLAAAVKNRRWRLLPLTAVFAAGLALVLVPITLGVSLVAGAIAMYHQVLYWAGGLLMIGLGVLSLTGRMWSMPSLLRAPDTDRADTATFFSLGVFSGIASSCCAPVLAGVMTLSALAGSPAGGLVLGLSYVFGMVVPLFVLALIWDRLPERARNRLRSRPVRFRVAGRVFATTTLNIGVAVAFVAMGIAVIARADAPDMSGAVGPLTPFGDRLAQIFATLLRWTDPVPEPVLGLVLLASAAVFVWASLRDRRPRGPADDRESPHPSEAPHRSGAPR